MKHIVCLKINGDDILGFCDKDLDFDLIAFATLNIRNPVVVISTASGMSFRPYFHFAAEVVATFNSNCIEAFLPENELPTKIVKKYRAFSAADPKAKKLVRSA